LCFFSILLSATIFGQWKSARLIWESLIWMDIGGSPLLCILADVPWDGRDIIQCKNTLKRKHGTYVHTFQVTNYGVPTNTLLKHLFNTRVMSSKNHSANDMAWPTIVQVIFFSFFLFFWTEVIFSTSFLCLSLLQFSNNPLQTVIP
jgi:hypothetical protein